MSGRDLFTVIIRGFGVYFIYRAIEGGIGVLAVACGFDLHLRNNPVADSFVYLAYFLIGSFVIAWANRLARFVYRRESAPMASEI